MANQRVAFALIVAAVLSVAACSSSAGKPAAAIDHLHASWADGYPTITEMTTHATVVVEGTVTGVSGHGQLDNTGNNLPGGNPPAVPYTDFSFGVTSVLKGSSPASITLRQTGGTAADGALAVVDDDPLLTPGQRAILFLRKFGPDQYFIMGGPAGRFPVDPSGRVTEMPGGSVISPPTSAAAFTRAVRAATTTQ
jgi:hypothetical protein